MTRARGMAAALAALALAAAAAAQGAPADRYPSRTVTIVVPYPPGGSNDVIARTLAMRLSDDWKVPVVVENRSGAGGTAGAALVARAKPDGYTLGMVSSSFTTSAAIRPSLPFDPIEGFTPVSRVARGPLLLAVSAASPSRTTLELFARAREHPGLLSYGSSGVGSINHFVTELLMDAAQIRMTHVPYRGMSGAVTDLIGGRIDVLVASAPSIYAQVEAGRVRALGITSQTPSPLLPGLRPLAEMGVPGYRAELWWGLLAPPKTPPAIVDALAAEVARAVEAPGLRAAFAREGAQAAPLAAAPFAEAIRREIAQWRRVAKDADIRPD